MSEQEGKKEEVAVADAPKVESAEPATTVKDDADDIKDAESKPSESKDESGKRIFTPEEKRRYQEKLRRTYKSSGHNVRTDFEALPETDDPDEIRKQVEFYFSDSNLAYDDHMRSRVLGNNQNEYGANLSVPIKDIHSFKRMKRFQPYSAVVAALKESTTLDVVGDKEDEIQRKTPLEKPKDNEGEFGDPSIPRAIYAKGFPEEGRTTQFDIEAFFTPYGPINSVRLRRSFPDRIFKGSVFVEFETEELQKEFLAIDPKPKFEGHELLIKSKRQYCDEKLEDVKTGKIQSNKKHLNYKGYLANDERRNDRSRGGSRGRGGRGGRGDGRDRRGGGRSGGRDRRDRDGGDADNWRSRRDDFQKNGNRERRRRSRSGSDQSGRNTKKEKTEEQQTETGAKDETSIKGESETKSEHNGVSKKRSREDNMGDEIEAKKAKGEGEVAA